MLNEPEDTGLKPKLAPVSRSRFRLLRHYAEACLIVFLALGGLGLLAAGWIAAHGVSARDAPTVLEGIVARITRHLAVPAKERRRTNPIPPSTEALAEGMAHWADHCASCHGNDGRGDTEMGRNMYPKAPDMLLQKTQGLSDGELYTIIKNGVRLTGMPAWGSPGPDEDSQTWKLVLFIRHLKSMTPEQLEQMKAMNPVSPMAKEAAREADAFLSGSDASEPSTPTHTMPQPGASRKEKP